jgi:hypothetical protein
MRRRGPRGAARRCTPTPAVNATIRAVGTPPVVLPSPRARGRAFLAGSAGRDRGAREGRDEQAPSLTLTRVAEAGEQKPSSPEDFDAEFGVGPEDGNKAYFGRNVLRGLVDGIDDFIQLRQPRWKQYRTVGPAMLASAMWIDDPELIDKLGELSGASVVVTKQGGHASMLRRLEALQELNDRTPGLPVRAFAGLMGLGPTLDGEPTVVGPYDPPVG